MNSTTYLINIIKQRGNVKKNIIEFLRSDNGDNYNKLIKLSYSNAYLKSILNKPIYQESLDETINWAFFSELPLTKVLLWSCLSFSKYSDELKKFTTLKRMFENSVLSKRYENALEILERVEENYGLSMWLIESYGVLGTFDGKIKSYAIKFNDRALAFFEILNFKNNIEEKNDFFRKRMEHMFAGSNISDAAKNYYMYRLFLNVPNTEQAWKDILRLDSEFSIIDVFLSVKDCLQHYKQNKNFFDLPIIRKCIEIIESINLSSEIDNLLELVNEFDKKHFQKVIECFFSEKFDSYDVFDSYRFVATSFLVTNMVPENSPKVLCYRLVRNIFYVLGRGRYFFAAINELNIFARVLKSFDIHKGISIFISMICDSAYYYIEEQYNTYGAKVLFDYELATDNFALIPYKTIYLGAAEEHLESIQSAIEENDFTTDFAKNYFIEAETRVKIALLAEQNNILEATSLFVQAYTTNQCLACSIDIERMRKYFEKKVELCELESQVTLEECCYMFIDTHFVKHQRDCFLNFLDNNGFNEPLDILNTNPKNWEMANYFLSEICNLDMLTKIYWLYKSNDDAINYRIKICESLIERACKNDKVLKQELEELTKKLTMRERLQNVDKSRISIDTSSFRMNTIEAINEQISLYNNSDVFYKVTSLPGLTFLYNPKKIILSNMYYIYAKEFCFGINGLDSSLSTRVRHGTLSNQLLRTFSDNYLTCDGHGSNVFFEKYILNDSINIDIKEKLLSFAERVKSLLNYLTQNTLKVFIEEVIEGAVFDYNLNVEEEENLYNYLYQMNRFSADDFINAVSKILINKTNSFLEQIRSIILPKLKTDLYTELDSFCESIQTTVKNNMVLKQIEGKIADCKIALQTEFGTIIEWFYITEVQKWEDFDFNELIDMCIEIEKKLFSGFGTVKIRRVVNNNKYKGKTFRYFVDALVILFNNAIIHSGYKDNLSELEIDCSVTSDSKSIYFVVENNVCSTKDVEKISKRIEKFNDDYSSLKFLEINTHQEGGMGLYKIMSMLYSAIKEDNLFHISVNENKVRVEIRIKKEVICCE